MKCIGKSVLIILCTFSLFSLTIYSPSTAMAAKADKGPKVNAAFDASKMGDMSDFDPANPIIPTGRYHQDCPGGFFFRSGLFIGTGLLGFCSLGGP